MRTRRLWVVGIAVLLAMVGIGWGGAVQTEAQICGGDCGAKANKMLYKQTLGTDKCIKKFTADPTFDQTGCVNKVMQKCMDALTPYQFRYPTCCCPSATNTIGCVTNNDFAFDCTTLPSTPFKYEFDCGF